MSESQKHAAAVDRWMADAIIVHSSMLPAQLFAKALNMVWNRTQKNLGKITVLAVADRVIHQAMRQYPVLAMVRVEDSGFQLTDKEIASHAQSFPNDELELAMALRCVLVQLLTIIGRLTADSLTPHLYAEISKI